MNQNLIVLTILKKNQEKRTWHQRLQSQKVAKAREKLHLFVFISYCGNYLCRFHDKSLGRSH